MAVAKKQDMPRSTDGDEFAEKLERLMAYYGIEAGDYCSLALQLAIDFVPGFRPAPFRLEHGDYGAVIPGDKKGRPRKWNMERRDALIMAVDNVKKEHGLTKDHDAILHLAQHGEWAGPANRDLNKQIKTLKNALANARRSQRDTQRGLDQLLELLEAIKRDNPEKSSISLRD